jgi:hypothetical protein
MDTSGRRRRREVLVHLTAGFVADVFGSLAWTPMDVVKQRVQVARTASSMSAANSSSNSTSYTSSYHACRLILREDGVRGLYRGFGAGLATYGPYVSLYFALYEQWKAAFQREQRLLFGMLDNPYCGSTDLPFWVYLTGAASAAAVSAVLTCPLDVLKTRYIIFTYASYIIHHTS